MFFSWNPILIHIVMWSTLSIGFKQVSNRLQIKSVLLLLHIYLEVFHNMIHCIKHKKKLPERKIRSTCDTFYLSY